MRTPIIVGILRSTISNHLHSVGRYRYCKNAERKGIDLGIIKKAFNVNDIHDFICMERSQLAIRISRLTGEQCIAILRIFPSTLPRYLAIDNTINSCLEEGSVDVIKYLLKKYIKSDYRDFIPFLNDLYLHSSYATWTNACRKLPESFKIHHRWNAKACGISIGRSLCGKLKFRQDTPIAPATIF